MRLVVRAMQSEGDALRKSAKQAGGRAYWRALGRQADEDKTLVVDLTAPSPSKAQGNDMHRPVDAPSGNSETEGGGGCGGGGFRMIPVRMSQQRRLLPNTGSAASAEAHAAIESQGECGPLGAPASTPFMAVPTGRPSQLGCRRSSSGYDSTEGGRTSQGPNPAIAMGTIGVGASAGLPARRSQSGSPGPVGGGGSMRSMASAAVAMATVQVPGPGSGFGIIDAGARRRPGRPSKGVGLAASAAAAASGADILESSMSKLSMCETEAALERQLEQLDLTIPMDRVYRPFSFDIECTGLQAAAARIIEIAVVDVETGRCDKLPCDFY